MNRKNIGVLLGLGFAVLASAIGGLYLGIFLDKRSGRTFFAPVGLLLGLGAGFHRSWFAVKQMIMKKPNSN